VLGCASIIGAMPACLLRLRLAGGNANNPISFGIGAKPGHHEHLKPSASGSRSMVLRSIALLVPQPGQKTSSLASMRRCYRHLFSSGDDDGPMSKLREAGRSLL
jgi:hypothetical protein